MNLDNLNIEGKTEVVAIHGECDRKNRFFIIGDQTREDLIEVLSKLPSEYIMVITR